MAETGVLERPSILLVEDDAEIAGMLGAVLRQNGFQTLAAANAQGMDEALAARDVDLVLLDVMLPGEDGLSICRRLRVASGIPVILVTALGSDLDRILGLEIGADDYIAKPFNPREVVARIRAVLRRATGRARPRASRRRLRFSGWLLDPVTRRLTDPGGVLVSLTTAEFDLLLALCQNPGRVLSREQLLDLTHGGPGGTVDRSIDVHVSRIRQKIETDPREPQIIKTVRLGGYLFTPEVEDC